MSRVDQYNVTVVIGSENTGTWDKMTGGGVDSEETKYRPGNMQAALSLGGSVTVENVVISRLYMLDRDAIKVKDWISKVGKAEVKVTKQSLDVDGNTVSGASLVYTGKLKRVTAPEVDSEGNDPALLEIEVSTSGTVA
jgi:hypothetical protein